MAQLRSVASSRRWLRVHESRIFLQNQISENIDFLQNSGADSSHDLRQKFERVTLRFEGGRIPETELVPIPGHSEGHSVGAARVHGGESTAGRAPKSFACAIVMRFECRTAAIVLDDATINSAHDESD